MSGDSTTISVRLNAGMVTGLVLAMSLVVLTLGGFRDWYVFSFGTETALEDLRQIALDSEHCLGSYYSALLMVGAAIMMGINGQAVGPSARWRTHWRLLALVFLLMSIDESVSFHEVLIDPLRQMFGFSGFLTFAWIVPGAIFVLLFGASYARFMLALEDPLRLYIVLAGAIYVGGALGFEAVSGHFYAVGGSESLPYILAAFVEESLEIAGLTVLVLGLLSEFRRRRTCLLVSIDAAERQYANVPEVDEAVARLHQIAEIMRSRAAAEAAEHDEPPEAPATTA